jgi:hypothetical protein
MATTYAILDGSKYMNTVTYNGNGTNSTSITGVGFQTDFNWTKSRSSGSYSHQISDVVRGFSYYWYSNAASAEGNDPTNHIQSLNSNGYVINSGASFNASGETYVAWNWKAGSSTVTNNSGTITSSVNANPTAGFSVMQWTGNSTAGATIGHGLGAIPQMIIIKARINGNCAYVYHAYSNATPQNYVFPLCNANAAGAASWFMNNTAPTSSVFSLGVDSANNLSGQTYVGYCFAAVPGYSAFGSYLGNNSDDGPFVYLGFRPRYIMIKRADAASDWFILDSTRNTYNAEYSTLAPSQAYGESSFGSNNFVDFLSNGFKIRRDNNYGYMNASGGTYIYTAFGQNPFKYANAR